MTARPERAVLSRDETARPEPPCPATARRAIWLDVQFITSYLVLHGSGA